MWCIEGEFEMTTTNEPLDGVMGLERLEDMEDKLESILRKRTPIVSTELIGLIASKRHFDPIKEQQLIEKSKLTVANAAIILKLRHVYIADVDICQASTMW